MDHAYDPVHELTFGDLAEENARRLPLQTAVVCGDERISYAELNFRSDRLAAGLRQAGVVPGDRVLWLAQNCHHLIELMLACSRLGAIVCPANWRLQTPEVIALARDCRPRLIIAQDTEIGPTVRAAQEVLGAQFPFMFLEEAAIERLSSSGDQHPTQPRTREPVRGADPLLMIYSSAFSGSPSGALLSSTSLISEALMTAMIERLDHNDVFIASGALFHIGCWRYVVAMTIVGGTNIVVRRVDPVELCEVIDRERGTIGYFHPATQNQIAEANADGRYDLQSMRSASGPPAWNAMVSQDTSPWARHPQRYGQTEAGGIVTAGAYGPPPEGRHGRAAPLVGLRIVDDSGEELPHGEIGEIAVRGPLVMHSYHDRAAYNAAMRQVGWRLTGDLGMRHPDGSITFVGTKSRMLKCGAENVYPTEIENALRAHPDIADCAVIGVPDDRFFQVVRAIVVPAQPGGITEKQIIDYARTHLAHYKAPRSVALVDELPRDAGGGVDYQSLDKQFGGGNYPWSAIPGVQA